MIAGSDTTPRATDIGATPVSRRACSSVSASPVRSASPSVSSRLSAVTMNAS
jgi:hypothetical protein